VLPYIDVPLQHAHPEVLRRMKRPWDGERYLALFAKLRAAMPDAAIRSTFIVGFPGETDEEFAYLLEFMKAARMDRVGAFTYSREAGSAAAEMDGQVPFRVKRERFAALMELQQRISLELNTRWVGRTLEVLTEGEKDGFAFGRSFRDAPEIDGLVLAAGPAAPGSFRKVKIERADAYDLYGSLEKD